MKDQALTRRERKKKEQRLEMLEAALALFAEKGYHNVSMHEIAEKAEFAIGTLYNFFQNKEDLYKAIVTAQSDRFEKAFTGALEEPEDEIEKLRNYIRVKRETLGANLSFVRLFMAESKGASFNVKAGLDEGLRKRYRSFLGRLARVFETGIEKRLFNQTATPFYLAVALDSVIDAHLLLWLQSPEEHPFPDDPDMILNIFFDSLINR